MAKNIKMWNIIVYYCIFLCLLLHLSLLSLVSYWPWSGQMEGGFAFDACFGIDGLRLWIKSVPSKMGQKFHQTEPTLPVCMSKE